MLRKILASLATLALGVGLAATAALPAHAGNTDNTNNPANWVVVSGETCEKVDFTNGPTTLNRAALDALFSGLVGNQLTKVVIKAGSGGSSVDFENTAYYEEAQYTKVMSSTFWLAVGNLDATTFQHVDGAAGASGKNISHVIVCYVDPPDEPESVSGDATVAAQTCDAQTYTLVPGSITPVATTGVVYELWNSTKTVKLIADFAANSGALANGTYFVKVLPASGDYTVSEADTWLERVVGAFDGTCAPTSVSGDATVTAQTCHAQTYTLVAGSITPVAMAGVVYELWNSDKTVKLIADFAANSGALANGTYFVKVLPASGSYTVSEANTWLERVVGAYDAPCLEIKTLGDPFATQECVKIGDEEFPSTWSATLTIVAAPHVQYRVFFHNGFDWVEQGLWVAGVYTAGPGGDFPYGTKIKVVAEAVGNYILTSDPNVWEFEFTEPFRCQQSTEGTVTPIVTFAQTCSAGATYTLGIEGGVAGTVLFSVNGGPTTTALGTFAAGSPSSISIVATPGPGSGFSGEEVNELTFTKQFPALTTCGDLTTLALTGDNVTPTLWVAGLLGLLGAACVRSARRISRVTAQS